MSRLLTIAQSYLGLKEDGGSNKFLESNPLNALLKAAGHQDGEAWCCYFQEGVAAKAYPEHTEWLDKIMSANCVQCAINLIARGVPFTAIPTVGHLVFFQLYKDGHPTSKGHVGLVKLASGTQFMSIDGNSNGSGARETTTGMVCEVNRELKFHPNGLNVIAFLDLEGFLANLKAKP